MNTVGILPPGVGADPRRPGISGFYGQSSPSSLRLRVPMVSRPGATAFRPRWFFELKVSSIKEEATERLRRHAGAAPGETGIQHASVRIRISRAIAARQF